MYAYCIHWHRNISNTATYFPSLLLAVSRVLHQTISLLWHDSAMCKVLWSTGVMYITNPYYCQHRTLLEEPYQLNIPWKQVKYNTDNAYQAVHVCYMNLSRVLRLWIEHQSINIIGTMLKCCLLYCLTYNFGPHYWYWGCPLSWWFLIKKWSGDSSRRCQNFLNGWISTVK